MIVILIGVSGSGKTAIGKALSKELNIPFYDGDDFHSKKNKEKMAQGIPLTDQDRKPWLKSLVDFMKAHGEMILACSALKASYRKILQFSPEVRFIYLKGTYELIHERLSNRKGHFFNPELLRSQFDALEEPEDALVVDIALPVNTIIKALLQKIKNSSFKKLS